MPWFQEVNSKLRQQLRTLERALGQKLDTARSEEQKRRDGLLGTAAIVAVLIATVAYTALLSVPGAWSATACSGAPTSQDDTCAVALHQSGFKLFMYANACALGFALGTVGIVIVLTMNATACGGRLRQADRLSGQAALAFVIAGVIALLISSIGAYKIILPHSWHVPAVILVVLVGISINMIFIFALREILWPEKPSPGAAQPRRVKIAISIRQHIGYVFHGMARRHM